MLPSETYHRKEAAADQTQSYPQASSFPRTPYLLLVSKRRKTDTIV
ncbi:hypothetical protein OKW39_001312 [Paraburkholderia sp. MM6662-R1]